MGPTRTALEDSTATGGDWFVAWLRSVALATSTAMVCGFVVAAVTDLSRALVAIPAAVVWALAAVALAYREPAGGAAAAVAGSVFAIGATWVAAVAFSDGLDSRGWMYCAVLLVAAVAGVTGAGFWLRAQPARGRRLDAWALTLELACYVTGAIWVVFGIASVYAFIALGAIGLGWIVVGFVAGRGGRIAAGIAAVAGTIFCAGWVVLAVVGSSPSSTPAWAWAAAVAWFVSAAVAAIAGGVATFRRGSRS